MTDRTDNFNRTDSSSSLGTPSDGGSAWVAEAGTWGISTNRGYKVASADTSIQSASLESSVSAVNVQVTLTQGSQAGGLIFRCQNATNCFIVTWGGGGANLYLYREQAGTPTQIGSTYSATLSANSVLKATVDSSNNITIYVDGVSRITATDSFGSTNTKHGLYAYDIVQKFDDFSITAISAGGGFFARYYYDIGAH